MVPEWLKSLLIPARPSLLLDVGEKHLSVTYGIRGKWEPIGEIDLSSSTVEQQRQELTRILAAQRSPRPEVVLRLRPAQSIRWRLAFPGAAASDLPQAIAFQISQKTPFQAADTFYDHRIVECSPDGSRIWVEVALAARREVLADLARAQAWQVVPDRIDVASEEEHKKEDAKTDAGFNLLPQDRRKKTGLFIRRLNTALAMLVAGLLALSVALPLLQQEARLKNLEQQLDVARREAAATRRLQSEIEELSRQRNFLAARKQGRPLQVVVIEELTRVLPDHTFLSELRVKGADINITGSSASASSLVGRLESSPLFQTPKFRSSVTQDPRSGLERFSLSFNLASETDADASR